MPILASDLFPVRPFLGAWASQSFTSSGTFVAPSDAPLNANGKVEIFITATAAGGAGGGLTDTYEGGDNQLRSGQGGQAGQWTRRYLVELSPGESISVTIPGSTTASGGSLTFGSYLTLSGGAMGSDGQNHTGSGIGASAFNGSRGISSGSHTSNNVIYNGCRGGAPGSDRFENIYPFAFGDSNYTMGSYSGGDGGTHGARYHLSGGGGGAGLFGDGGAPNSGNAAANGGGGGGGRQHNAAAGSGGTGAGGQLLVEWRLPE